MAKILLTGVAGFIGSHVYKKLSKNNEIIAIDNLTDFSNYEIKLHRLQELGLQTIECSNGDKLEHSKQAISKVDITNIEKLKQFFSAHKFDVVIHLAALTGVRQSITNPSVYEQVNVTGFTNIIECCKNHDVKKIIYASSSSVYGGNLDIPFQEDASIDNLLNYYAVTKRTNELTAQNYSALYQMQVIGLRFFTVYGPWTRPDMATFSFMKNMLEGKPITLFNNGNMERDFTYIDDIIESIARVLDKLLLMEKAKSFHAVFNIGEGKPINLNEYVKILEEKMKRMAIIENAPMNKEEMLRTFADCTKLFNFIDYKPTVSVDEGLGKTVEWFLEYQRQL